MNHSKSEMRRILTQFGHRLVDSQEPLEAEFQRVIHDNIDKLYMTENNLFHGENDRNKGST